MVSSVDQPSTLSRTSRMHYASGSIATGIFNSVPSALLLYYATDVVGISPLWAGCAIGLPKVVGIITDPLIGSLSDGSSRNGRAPFLYTGGIGLAVGLFATFSVPPWALEWQRGVYLTLVYSVASLAYGVFAVPYIAIASELSPDPWERERVLATRMIALMAGLLMGAAGAPFIVMCAGGGRTGYSIMGATLAFVALFSTLCVAAGSARWRRVDSAPSARRSGAHWRVIRSDRGFVFLALAQMSFSGAVAAVSALLPFIVTRNFGEDEARVGELFLCWIGASLIAAPIWPGMSRRFGKPVLLIAIMASFAAMSGIIYCVGPRLDITGLRATLVLLGALFSGSSVLAYAAMTDFAVRAARSTGANTEGVYSGAWTAFEKIGLALGPLAAASTFAVFGSSAATVQTMMSLIPASLALAALLILALGSPFKTRAI